MRNVMRESRYVVIRALDFSTLGKGGTGPPTFVFFFFLFLKHSKVAYARDLQKVKRCVKFRLALEKGRLVVDKDDRKFAAMIFDDEGAIYFNVARSGAIVGKVRVGYGAMAWQTAKKFTEVTEGFGGEEVWSAGDDCRSWSITGHKALRFLKEIYGEINDELLRGQIRLYAIGFESFIQGKKMTKEVIRVRREIALELRGLRDERKRLAREVKEGLSVSEVKKVKGGYEEVRVESDKEVVDVDEMLLLDHRKTAAKAAVKWRDREESERKLRENIESFGDEFQDDNKLKLEKHKKEMYELGIELGLYEWGEGS